ncbi:hypothetical protein SeMB42_g01196 [Synchytrium endobioticum]|uniref:Uncharacterized protein n=1 Tax=Synchytrium endobioticum TaxID=286115 RepID=A0A507DPB8_9FUNG|nr:hypothetical protein SeMB42_g01196 [Synchytrium endobioticum]
MPKSFYQKLDRLTRRSFLVNDDVKTGLAAALEAEFKVEKAPGEADVYIARVATDLDIIVSGDSDVFCYRNVKLPWKMIHQALHHRYRCSIG